MWAEFGWLVWLVLGGLFLFLMFRGGGCCGGHGGHEGHSGGSGNDKDDRVKSLEGHQGNPRHDAAHHK
jgi:hypothetical protein